MNNTRTDLRSQSLDLLRFPLAVVVILIHVFVPQHFSLRGQTLDVASMPAVTGAYEVVVAFLKGQSVPVYYFISGYVFFLGVARLDRATWLRKMRNRARSLFVPFVVWNVLAVAMVALMKLPALATLLPGMDRVTLHFDPASILNTFWDQYEGVVRRPVGEMQPGCYPANIPLWFIRELMVVALCSPLVRWFVRNTGRIGMAALGCAWLGVQVFVPFCYLHMILTAFTFFAWGAGMSLGGRDMIGEFGRRARPMALAYVSLCLAHLALAGSWPWCAPLLKSLAIVAGLFTAFNAAAWLLRRGLCRVSPLLAGSSFFLYISHWLIYDKCLKLAFVLLRPAGAAGVLAGYALGLCLTVGILLATYALLRRFAPALLRAVAGAK